VAGGGARNRLDDTIQITNLVNHHPPYECTNKGLGGSSATWGGRCVMYDDVDFLERPVVQGGCTWDLELFAEAKIHVPTAAEYFECGRARSACGTCRFPQCPHRRGFCRGRRDRLRG